MGRNDQNKGRGLESESVLGGLRREGKLMVLIPFFCSYVFALIFATWDRLEMLVPAQMGMVVTLIAVVVFIWSSRGVVFEWFDIWIFLGATYFIIRAIISPVAYYGNVDAGLAGMGLACWLVSRNVLGKEVKYLWLLVTLVMVLLHLGASYYQYSENMQWGFLRVRSSQVSISISGFYGHYNYLANYLAMIACGMLGVVFHGNYRKLFRVVALVVLLAAVGGLIWAKSRGGLVAFGSGVFIYLSALVFLAGVRKNDGRWKMITGTILIACIVGAGLLAVAGNFAVRRGYSEGDGFLKDNGRLDNIVMAVDQIIDGSIQGAGARSFEWVSANYWLDEIWGRSPIPNYVHNEYLQSMTDYGFLGGVILFVTLFVVLLLSGRAILMERENSDILSYNMAGVAMCAAFLTQCLFSFPAHVLANLLTFVIAVHFATYRSMKMRNRSRFCCAGFSVLALSLCVVLGHAAVMGAPTFFDRFDEVAYQRESEKVKAEQLDNRLAKITALTEWRPDFKNLKRKGELHWLKASKADNLEHRQTDLSLAAEAYQSAAEKYPEEPSLNMNAGLALDRLYRFEEAEKYFLAAFSYGERADFWIKSRWNLANHYYLHGRYLWMNRKPTEGLRCFYIARELLAGKKATSFRRLQKQIEENIVFMENAGIGVDSVENLEIPSR